DGTTIIADAGLSGSGRIAAGPTGRSLVGAVDFRVTADAHTTLGRQRRLDTELDRRDARDHADALARAAAAVVLTRRAPVVLTRDVDQEDVRTHPVPVAPIGPGAARRVPGRNGDGAFRILLHAILRRRIPQKHALLGAGLRDAEGGHHATLVFAHPLLLGAGEERSRDQRAHNDEGEDRDRERHTAFIMQDPTHTSPFECSGGWWRLVEVKPPPTFTILHDPPHRAAKSGDYFAAPH